MIKSDNVCYPKVGRAITLWGDRKKSNPIIHLKTNTQIQFLLLTKKGDDLVEIISLGLSGFDF